MSSRIERFPHVGHDTIPRALRRSTGTHVYTALGCYLLPTASRLGHVPRQAHAPPCRRERAPRARPRSLPPPRPGYVLQLLRALRLGTSGLGPPRRHPHTHPPQVVRRHHLAGGRHPGPQARQERLGLGLVPRRRGLDEEARGDRQRPQLDCLGRGRLLAWHRHPHPGPAVVGPAAPARPGATPLCRPGAGDARRGAGLVAELDERVTFVGRLRGDAALYDPRVPPAKKGQRGQKAKKGARLPKPKEAAAKADRKRKAVGDWVWQDVDVAVYGCARSLKALAYEVVWPTVLGYRVIQVVVVRDPSGRMRDCYLFTTDLKASLSWVITRFAWRWAIEVLFRASKQVMGIEAPQHWSQGSVEKVAPWVWSMQSVVMVWYITAGYASAEAEELRGLMGEWDSEWSLRHMIQVLRRAILNATIDPNSANEAELREMTQTLKNWANLAA